MRTITITDRNEAREILICGMDRDSAETIQASIASGALETQLFVDGGEYFRFRLSAADTTWLAREIRNY